MTEWEEYLQKMKNSVPERSTNRSDATSLESQTEKTTDFGTDVCPICHGTGWELIVDENGYEAARECQCGIRAREIQESKLRFAAIPTTYRDIRLKDLSLKYYTKQESKSIFRATCELIKWYLENLDKHVEEGKGIYFWSETKGSGKTMMASALANELINEHKRLVKFATSLDILDEIRSTYDEKSEQTESKLLHDLVNTEFLVIDDFGTERATDWAREKFYQIVNKRYIDRKVTFFTSNYDLKTLKYDDRISNRIRERAFLVHFPEESVREYKARQDDLKIRGDQK